MMILTRIIYLVANVWTWISVCLCSDLNIIIIICIDWCGGLSRGSPSGGCSTFYKAEVECWFCAQDFIGVVSVTAARRFILLLSVCSFKTHLGKNNIEKCPWSCCSCHLEEWKYSVHLITWVSVSSFNYSCCCCCCCLGGGRNAIFTFYT